MSDPKEIWARSLDKIRAEVSEQNFSTWFDPIACLEAAPEKVLLGLPDQFLIDWVKDHYQELLGSSLRSALGSPTAPEISFQLIERAAVSREEALPSPSSGEPASAGETLDSSKGSLVGLNPNYTFESFVVGSGNRFAQAAAYAVAESPAKRYNPLFIYGSSGLGKTHLMQAIAHEIVRKNPAAKALYVSSEQFVNQLVHAIQNKTQLYFRKRFRNLDILLIDDIHFIAGKDATQEELFHTFNALHDHHKQIVISSDRPPKDIPGLEERLVSRFQWGLVVDVQPPDFETRLAILRKKIERETAPIPGEVLEFIAQKIKSNIRELEGALLRVIAFSHLTGSPVTIENTQEILRSSLIEETKKITIELIQKKTAEYYDISISDMRVKKRSKNIALPRQVAMYLVRELTDHSLPEIGQYFGGRDHTTVLHAYNKIAGELKTNTNVKKAVEHIKNLLV